MAEDDLIDPFDPKDVASGEVSAYKERHDAEVSQSETLRIRQEAYQRVFQGKGFANDLRIVMADLQRFCRGNSSAFHVDARAHALLTGRQEVWLRIKDHTELTLSELVEKYIGAPK